MNYWHWQSADGRIFSCAVRNGETIMTETSDAIVKLEDAVSAFHEQRLAVQQIILNRQQPWAPPMQVINEKIASLKGIDANIATAEANLWRQLLAEKTNASRM